jgi:hypothetical protein
MRLPLFRHFRYGHAASLFSTTSCCCHTTGCVMHAV